MLNACQKSPECLDGRTYASGDCNCAEGYEGNNCDVLTVAKFLGRYNLGNYLIEVSDINYYYLTITRDSLIANKVKFKAERDIGSRSPSLNFTGNARGDHIDIPRQNIQTTIPDINQNGSIEGEICLERDGTLTYLRANIKILYKANDYSHLQYFWYKG
jgi:hypothetical protein